MDNTGTYIWRIVDADLIRKICIRSAKCGDDFSSDDVFQVGKLNWKIELNPNGRNEESKGFCGVCVRLLGMPSSWKSIFCQIHIECLQMQNKMVFTNSYNKPSGTGFYISSFEELKASFGKELTFVTTIRIARITLKEDNKILFQMRANKYKPKTQLQWKIDQEMMEKLKSFDKGKGICSDILNDIWCLQLHPNGDWYGKEGDVRIALSLCGLPPNVSKMNVQWTVHCHEANIKHTFTNDFDEENEYWNWKKNTMSFSEFCKYNTWTVTVNVNVLNEFDLDGNDAIESAWNEYKEPANDDNTRAVIPYDDDLKEKLQFYDAAIQSLSMNMETMQKTLQQIQNKMEESKEEEISLNEVMNQISILKRQMASANSQQQRRNPDHERVREWLRNEVNLVQYHALFIENGFEDLESIKSLNMEILNMMQIDKIGHKMKILRCVAKLNQSQNEGNTAYI